MEVWNILAGDDEILMKDCSLAYQDASASDGSVEEVWWAGSFEGTIQSAAQGSSAEGRGTCWLDSVLTI